MKIPDYDPYNPHLRSPNADQEAWERFILFNSPKTAGPGYENFGPVIELRVFAGNIMLDYYSKCDESFDPVVPYLAMNYFDRVISMQYPMAVPAVFGAVDSRKDKVQFLALCCLTLSWKMRSTTFTIKKLQEKHQLLRKFTIEQFLRTEIYILKKLEWRMRPITAFFFLGYLEPMFLDYPITRFNRRTINKIIIQSQSEPLFTYLKPSLITTIALLVASLCLCPAKYSSFCHKLVSGNVIAQCQAVIYLPCMVNLCKDLQLSGLSSGISLNDQLLISTAHATFSNFHPLINNREFLCFVYKMLIDHLIFVSKYKEIVANGINNGESSSSSSSSSMGLKICKDIQFDFPLRWKLSGLLKDDDDEAIFGFHGLLLRLPLVRGLRFFSSPLMHFLNKMNICLQTIPNLSSAPYQQRQKLQQALNGFTNYRMKMEDEAIRLVNLMKLRGSTIS